MQRIHEGRPLQSTKELQSRQEDGMQARNKFYHQNQYHSAQ